LLPSFSLILLLSVLYVEYQSQFDFNSILMGITPVIIGVIFSVAVNMWSKNCDKISKIITAIISVIILFLFPGYWSAILVLLAAGLLGVLIYKQESAEEEINLNSVGFRYLLIPFGLGIIYLIVLYNFPENMNVKLFTEFSTVSLTLFGGGYVMVPMLKSLLVDQLQWFTHQEFIFGISLGQITPGPILISAVYFGYKMNGIIGAVIATLGIFIPSSLAMILASRFYIRLKNNRSVKAALAGIKPAVTGLIFYSGLSLFFSHLELNNLWFLLLLTPLAFLSIFKFNINPAIAVIFGGLLGYSFKLFF
jgi:chromate transporter